MVQLLYLAGPQQRPVGIKGGGRAGREHLREQPPGNRPRVLVQLQLRKAAVKSYTLWYGMFSVLRRLTRRGCRARGGADHMPANERLCKTVLTQRGCRARGGADSGFGDD